MYRAQYALLELEKEGPDGLPVPMQTSNWAIPKIGLMRYWVRTIRAFGSANVTSTGFGERSHVSLKDSLRFTNRHCAEKIDAQVLLPVELCVVIRCSQLLMQCMLTGR